MGCTKSYTLHIGCTCTADCWHVATGHPLIVSPNPPAKVAHSPRKFPW